MFKFIILIISLVVADISLAKTINLNGPVDKENIANILNELDSAYRTKDDVTIIIDSGGGLVHEGDRLIRKMKRYGESIKINCIVDGKAASMAFHIFANCPHNKAAYTGSILMWHGERFQALLTGKLVIRQRMIYLKEAMELFPNMTFKQFKFNHDNDVLTYVKDLKQEDVGFDIIEKDNDNVVDRQEDGNID